MNAEILAIGDEITGGQLLDTNSQWLSQRLGELGVRVLYHSTVGDELQPCIDVFRRAIQRAEVVISTGGLGPTADDLTREALAAATDRPLVMSRKPSNTSASSSPGGSGKCPRATSCKPTFPRAAASCRIPTAPRLASTWKSCGRTAAVADSLPCPACRRKCARCGTAICWRPSGAWVAVRVILRRNIKCFGVGESQLESLMPDLIRRGRVPRVGINASRATIILRIVAEGDNEEECRAQIEPTVAEIHKHLGTLVYGEGDDELQDVVVRLLGERGQTLASAEIATAGLVAQWLAKAGGGGGRYRGGLVAADEAAMTRLLPLGSAAPRTAAKCSSARWRSLAASSFRPISAWPSARCLRSATAVKPRRSISPWLQRPACRPCTFHPASTPTSSATTCQARHQPGAVGTAHNINAPLKSRSSLRSPGA